MNKKILAIFGVILLLIATAVVFKKINRAKLNTPSPSGTPASSDIPNEYRKFYDESNKWLDQKLVEWKPTEYTPMKFNGHLIFASEQVIDTTGKSPYAASMDQGFLEMFKELDTDTISLFIYPDMYAKYSERYDNMINSIRVSKKQLYISYMVGGGNGFIKFKDFEEYRNTELDFTRDFISKYHPDYYVIVDEITTMERRTGLNAPDEEWGKLVLEVNDLVKDISPQTKTVATGHSQELTFLKALADNIPSLDMIGMNIWGIDQIDETTSIGKKFKDTIAYVQAKNKGVVFEQTWALLHDAPEAKKLSTLDFMKEPDAKYIKVLTYYASMNKIDIYSPFYVGKFIEYSSDPVKFMASFNSKQRTPAYYAYKSIIEEFKNNQK